VADRVLPRFRGGGASSRRGRVDLDQLTPGPPGNAFAPAPAEVRVPPGSGSGGVALVRPRACASGRLFAAVAAQRVGEGGQRAGGHARPGRVAQHLKLLVGRPWPQQPPVHQEHHLFVVTPRRTPADQIERQVGRTYVRTIGAGAAGARSWSGSGDNDLRGARAAVDEQLSGKGGLQLSRLGAHRCGLVRTTRWVKAGSTYEHPPNASRWRCDLSGMESGPDFATFAQTIATLFGSGGRDEAHTTPSRHQPAYGAWSGPLQLLSGLTPVPHPGRSSAGSARVLAGPPSSCLSPRPVHADAQRVERRARRISRRWSSVAMINTAAVPRRRRCRGPGLTPPAGTGAVLPRARTRRPFAGTYFRHT
jgi:hypothetical protein